MTETPRDHVKHTSEPKKRKRNRKAQPDKKFECQHEGCGKSYSRAEHLHRHQLNHTPKQIYRCDFPDCYRSFVRQDLCIRHRERHTTHGSQLQKRDSFTQAAGRPNISSSPQPLHAQDDPSAILSPTSQTSKPIAPYESVNGKDSYMSSRYGGDSAKTQQTMYGSGTPYGSNFQGNSFSSNSLRDNTNANANSTYMGTNGLGSPTAYMSQQGLSMPDLGYSSSELPQTQYVTTGMNALGSVNGMVPESREGEMGFDSSYPYPVFGGESSYNRSPFAMADDFAAWLFNEPTNTSVNYSNIITGYTDLAQTNPISFLPNDPSYNAFSNNLVSQHPMSVTNIVDSTPPEAMMSEEKRQDILHLISTRFNETAHSAVKTKKESLMEGNIDADGHILSLRMMQTPDPVATAAVSHGNWSGYSREDARTDRYRRGGRTGQFFGMAYQALLLLEIYEKGYSTRALHERAHIHHDTTLTLMRRGSSFLGRSAYDTPASFRDERANRSVTTTTDGEREDPWSYWIRTEATRRVAFGAFVMDSIHATMFGHSVKMVAHELRLPLPCDEALWSAGSAAEVSRMQTVLQSNGVKPTMFLDGLKKTLTGQKVRTNAFGRMILMGGLLSVSWHMNQRDLQVSSLGVTQVLGGRDKWRSSLLRAFDNWKRDYDETLAESGHRPYSKNSPGFYQQHLLPFQVDEDDTYESRTVLHHLAHMAAHVDIVDCQVFAGASRLLSRSITPKDYSTAREKMTERWATKASARDATFYALKFLCHVLLQPASPQIKKGAEKRPGYSAVEDYLLHRSWAVYFSALVVWSYGYALEGPVPSPPELSSEAAQLQDMQRFLQTVGAVREPNDLEHVTGRNQCLGLLLHLRTSFLNTRWELLHEAALLLDSCVQKLKTPIR
ncbi:hypothetical protein EYB26_003663 [Talaromyces marneffei]|uniref:uncharacterized protein n=1 Tax=Talaromyces marneffei TaxID=37727 RepID=UPI0012A923A4|nr:uncharacterized protein EYB26_003663 [Talaromyces marneffei]QGA15996.1 hypothetical protein EYB26_003663 [Talaromyces marneffei]